MAKKESHTGEPHVPNPTGVSAIKPGAEGKGEDNPMQGSTGTATPGQDKKVQKIGAYSGRTAKSKDQGDKTPPKQGTSDVPNLLNKKVTREDIDLSTDVDALFEGVELSEEAKEKITTIFETAVVSKINEQLEAFAEDAEAQFEAARAALDEEMSAKLDDYLDYVVEEWMDDNKLAVEVGLKSQIVENFMKGLHTLFTENYIDVPESKVDVVDELVSRVDELESEVNDKINENVQLRKQVEAFEREIVFAEVTEGLTDVQAAKLESLAEAVDFEDAESFKEKIAMLRENYFPKNGGASTQKPLNESAGLDNEPVEADEEKNIDPRMRAYVSNLSRSVKK